MVTPARTEASSPATKRQTAGASTGTSARNGRRNGSSTGAAASSATRASARPGAAPEPAPLHLRGRLFDARAEGAEVELSRKLIAGLRNDQILWVDVAEADDDEIAALGKLFELRADAVRMLRNPVGRPRVDLLAPYLQIYTIAITSQNDTERPVGIAMITGSNYLITVHREPLEFLDAFGEHLAGGSAVGLVDGPSFLAALLDWLLNGYFRVVEGLEQAADRLDRRALDPRSEQDLLADLVRLRRRISVVRRSLAPHREVFAALTRPDLTGMAETEAAPLFRALADRLERTIDAVENARDLVLGSFEVHMTQTAHRTNEVMKILTLMSAVMLPGALIAGVMGMNFKVGFFDDPNYFWIVLALIAAFALGTIAFARLRRWI